MRNTVLGRAVRYIFDILYGYGIIQLIGGLLFIAVAYIWVIILAAFQL